MIHPTVVTSIAELKPLLETADHVDVKIVEGDVPLREFLAQMFAYQPGWVSFLYGVRMIFVRLIGLKQGGIPKAPRYTADNLPMQPGEKAAFFTVTMAEDERYWVAGIKEAHLDAYLGVVVEPISATRRRFHVITIVHYNRWTGRFYFNVIRPFHHLVVGRMAQAGTGKIIKGEW